MACFFENLAFFLASFVQYPVQQTSKLVDQLLGQSIPELASSDLKSDRIEVTVMSLVCLKIWQRLTP